MNEDDYVEYLTRLSKSANVAIREQALALLEKASPHRYRHGWILIGGPRDVGSVVNHPEHGRGRVVGHTPTRTKVDFESGEQHAFEHGATAPKLEPSSAKLPGGDYQWTARTLEETARGHRDRAAREGARRPRTALGQEMNRDSRLGAIRQAEELEALAAELRRRDEERQRGTHFVERTKAPAKPRPAKPDTSASDKKPRTPRPAKAVPPTAAEMAARLKVMSTAEEARAALAGMSVAQLRDVAAEMNVPLVGSRGRSKKSIIDSVSFMVGAAGVRQAIREAGAPVNPIPAGLDAIDAADRLHRANPKTVDEHVTLLADMTSPQLRRIARQFRIDDMPAGRQTPETLARFIGARRLADANRARLV